MTLATCAVHRDALASFQCEGCRRLLCYDCVDEGHRLVMCNHCGEEAVPLDDESTVPAELPSPELDDDGPDILYGGGLESRGGSTNDVQPGSVSAAPSVRRQAALAGPPVARRLDDDPLSVITNMVVIPGATFVMVVSLLFFLIEVRSVFLPGTGTLRWLGFWFVLATVLIARLGKITGDTEKQGCYTGGLTVATLLAVVHFSARNGGGLMSALVNCLIIVAVWRFATAVTRGLSLEGEDPRRLGRRVYGLERVALEQWNKKNPSERPKILRPEDVGKAKRAPNPDGAPKRRPRPGVAVARLAAGVLVVFALGEPILLRAPPALGERGLAWMILFLLATGVVLGASAAANALRRVRQAEGRVAITTLPTRLVAAGLAMAVLLSMALAMPGISYRGSGELRTAQGGPGHWNVDVDRGSETDPSPGGEVPGESGGESAASGGQEPGGEQGAQGQSESSESRGELRGFGSPANFLGFFAELGRWLRWVVLAAVVVLGVLALRRLGPFLGPWRRSLAEWWGGFLAAWRRRFQRRPGQSTARTASVDPWRGIERLGGMAPREAVVEAFGHMVLAIDQLDPERPRDETPYEILERLAKRNRRFEPAARRLTEGYVLAAYGDVDIEGKDRDAALGALGQLRQLMGS